MEDALPSAGSCAMLTLHVEYSIYWEVQKMYRYINLWLQTQLSVAVSMTLHYISFLVVGYINAHLQCITNC